MMYIILNHHLHPKGGVIEGGDDHQDHRDRHQRRAEPFDGFRVPGTGEPS